MEGGTDFWQFSLSLYGEAAVAEACLQLQDEAGADVNLLLFLLWRAAKGRRLSEAEVTAVEEAVSAWRAEVVGPLRGVRRWLKHHDGLVAAEAAEALRQEVKRLELESERLQQQTMAALAHAAAPGEPAASPRQAAEASLAAYEAVRGRALPAAPVAVLLDRLAARSIAAPERAEAGGNGGG
jgi:uncharacterized protein (TIGR02444 family)